jgi:hypothetical protein
MRQWYRESGPLMNSLLASLDVAEKMIGASADAIPAYCDQLRTQAAGGQQWLMDHPCPDEEVGAKFEKQLTVYVGVAALNEGLAAGSGTGGPDAVDLPDLELDLELHKTNVQARTFLGVINEHMLQLGFPDVLNG